MKGIGKGEGKEMEVKGVRWLDMSYLVEEEEESDMEEKEDGSVESSDESGGMSMEGVGSEEDVGKKNVEKVLREIMEKEKKTRACEYSKMMGGGLESLGRVSVEDVIDVFKKF